MAAPDWEGSIGTDTSETQREKICISITEGCIRHYNEDPEIEEQFILRLPEKEAAIVHHALETDTLDKRLTLALDKNLREAQVTLDDTKLIGKVMDLPTIIESHKVADDSTLYKTADIAQILICSEEPNESNNLGCSKKISSSKSKKEFKYPNGLCPPLKNARKKRFRKLQLEENFNPDVDRAVKLLLRADGAAESVRFEIAYEDIDAANETSRIADETHSSLPDDFDNSSLPSISNEVDIFGETLSLSSDDDGDRAVSEFDFPYGLPYESTDNESEGTENISDIEYGNLEQYDFDTLTEEQKEHLAQLKEIDWCLSNIDCKISPPRPSTSSRGRGRGRGRGRPRVRPTTPDESTRTTPHVSMAGRGGRGRPPGRGRGRSCNIRGAMPAAPRGSRAGQRGGRGGGFLCEQEVEMI